MMVASQNEKKKRKRKKLDAPKTKKKSDEAIEDLNELDADDFMASFGDELDASPKEESVNSAKKSTKKKKNKNKLNPSEKLPKQKEETKEEEMETTPQIENIPGSGNVKAGLSRLEEKDSDFFKFLQENDPDLLAFSGGESSDDPASEDDEDVAEHGADSVSDGQGPEEDTEATEVPEPERPAKTATAVTRALLKKWEVGLKKNSLPTWKQLVRGFQSAVATARGDDPEVEMRYSIVDPDIVNRVIMMCLQYSADLLKDNLGENPTASPKWSKVKMSLKTYLSCLTDLLGLLTSNDVLCAVMRHCKAMLPYYAAFSRLIKKFVKGHVTVWGSKAELSRVVAFTCLQAVVKKIPTFLEDLLKAMYVEYTKCSKQMNPKTRDHVVLMRNCLVEMFKINPSVTYTTGFLYIRQLAVTLRSAIISNKDTETVYNWQFINCVHVWVCVLADCDACLQPLVFPLIQVMMGVIKLHNSPCFFPLHLHTIRMLLYLAEATNKHIPLIHPLLNVLEFCATAHKTQATKPIDLTCVLRVTKGYKKTKAYQDAIFDLTYELLLNYTAQLSGSIAFPEVTFPLTVWLKKFNKKCNSAKFTGQIKQILDKTEVVSRDITERRSAVEFTPKDLDKVAQWENQLPQSALTKYFNSWLKVHRTALAAAAANATEEDSEEEPGEDEEDDDSEDEKPVKKRKKGKKAKQGESSEKDEKTKKLKKKTAKTETKTDVTETAEFVDDGDFVEDFVMSD